MQVMRDWRAFLVSGVLSATCSGKHQNMSCSKVEPQDNRNAKKLGQERQHGQLETMERQWVRLAKNQGLAPLYVESDVSPNGDCLFLAVATSMKYLVSIMVVL
jgi:hypothetical protein